MTQFFSEAIEEERATRLSVRLRDIGLVIVALVTLGTMALVFHDIDRQLDHNATSDSDNVTWVIAQVEVDLLKLQRAAREAVAEPDAPDALERLRLAYDIFYSRMLVVKRSDDINSLPIDRQLNTLVWNDGAFLQRYTPLIDGSDPQLRAALPVLAADIDAMAGDIRQHVVNSLQSVMGEADLDRADLRRSLQVFAGASLALLGLLFGLVTVIFLQNRARLRRAETAARAVHNLRATIESSLDAVLIADHAGRVIDCNRASETLLGTTRAKVRGERFADLVHADGLVDPLHHLHERMRGKDDWADLRDGRLQMKVLRVDGATVPVEAALAEATGAGGEPMFIAFLRDISDRLEREESLHKARNDALKGEEAKARFLAVMSHEMRTPLNGLIAATELLQSSTRLDERQAWLTEIVISCGTAALDQVNNVLELTRLGSENGVSYPVAAFSPVQVVRDLILQNEPQAAKRGNRLTVEIKGDIPQVQAPRQLFVRVLYNLIGNAIKFTDAGSVTVQLSSEPVEGGKARLRATVEDTGIGIAETDLERIFQNFQTLDDSYARVREGTGLGLGIAKLSAEALGGEIHVTSVPGQGSAFTLDVVLPVADSQSEQKTSETTVAPVDTDLPRALSILVAEDNPINSLLLTEMLRLRGHMVTVAADGQEAVDAATATRFDLVLMDISMPRMDGLVATRLIRTEGASRDVPVIGVTANASPDRLPEFLQSGMSDVLVKPITRGALESVIATHCMSAPPASAPAVQQETPVLNDEVFTETMEDMGRDFVERVAAKFLTEAEASLAEVAGLMTSDLKSAARVAHKSAGAAAAIGLAGLHRTLAALESAALAGDGTGAMRCHDDASAMIPATVAALRARGLSIGAAVAG